MQYSFNAVLRFLTIALRFPWVESTTVIPAQAGIHFIVVQHQHNQSYIFNLVRYSVSVDSRLHGNDREDVPHMAFLA
jgi:hypothetical protein